jgi:hypothetical protein
MNTQLIHNLAPFVATVPDLTPDMMAEAKRKAKDAIMGEYSKPVKSANKASSKYPPIVVKYTTIALILLFITSFIPSAIHIYTAVLDEQKHVPPITEGISLVPMIQHEFDIWLTIIGICAVFGAELAIMVMVIGSQVFFSEKKNMQRWFYLPIGLALGIAYVGNWVAVKPDSIFDLLLMVAFPTFTLFISFIGKMLVLDLVQAEFEAELKYQNELKTYEAKIKHPELASNFLNVYNRYLLQYFKQVIGTGAGATQRKRIIAEMTPDEQKVFWSMLVNRTLDNEDQEFVRMVIPDTARSVTIHTSRAMIGGGAGGGLSHVSSVSSVSERQNVSLETSETKRQYSQPVQKAIDYFKENPTHISKTTRELEELVGVSKSTISRVLTAMKNNEIE